MSDEYWLNPDAADVILMPGDAIVDVLRGFEVVVMTFYLADCLSGESKSQSGERDKREVTWLLNLTKLCDRGKGTKLVNLAV